MAVRVAADRVDAQVAWSGGSSPLRPDRAGSAAPARTSAPCSGRRGDGRSRPRTRSARSRRGASRRSGCAHAPRPVTCGATPRRRSSASSRTRRRRRRSSRARRRSHAARTRTDRTGRRSRRRGTRPGGRSRRRRSVACGRTVIERAPSEAPSGRSPASESGASSAAGERHPGAEVAADEHGLRGSVDPAGALERGPQRGADSSSVMPGGRPRRRA